MTVTRFALTLTCALSTWWLNPAFAQTAPGQAGMDHSQMGNRAMPTGKTDAHAMTLGEVRMVDLKAQTITLKHGPIVNLDMPGMTMAFKVKTPALLGKAKAGDKVRFSAEMAGDALTLTAIELAR